MDNLSRRAFLGSGGMAGLGLSAAEVTGAPPEQLSPNLFRFEDTCSVYVIRDGSRAVLIDFGSGGVLAHLPALGITRVDGILHTHHHRDQCQGDPLAVARRIPIAVPAYEAHLFTDVENFWRNRRVYHEGYVTRNDYLTLMASIPVAATIPDYETFRCGTREFFVLPTPGHTLGSITLLTEIDGRRVAFSGDLLAAPGKVHSLAEMQHHYGGNEGVDFTIHSLSKLAGERPALLCPSHGRPMAEPRAAIEETIAVLSDYYRLVATAEPSITNQPFAISPHLVGTDKTAGNFYAVVSDSGKALLVDYGFPSGEFSEQFVKATPVNGRCRFIEHNLDALRQKFGVKQIDVALPTHTNDDHYCGFPYLQRKYGTRIWCYQSMKEVLENPAGHRLGCILPEPIRIDRSFRHGERFRWEEFEFLMTHNPGHAEHQMALFAEIDGRRVVFTGDNFTVTAGRPMPDGSLRIRPVVLNSFVSDSYQKAIRNLIEHRPDLIAPGHGPVIPVTAELLEATRVRIDKRAEFYRKLVADPDTDFGLDPGWVKIYPYQMTLRPGEPAACEIRVHNYRSSPMRMTVSLVLPAGWRAEPAVLEFDAPPRQIVSRPFRLHAVRSPGMQPRLAIAADVTADGKRLGQITEAMVNWV